MKTQLALFFSLWTCIAFAQPSGDIEKDTALANQYFEQAWDLFEANDISNQADDLLEKANALYEAHPFDERLIEIKGLWSIWLVNVYEMEAAKEMAQAAITLAEKKLANQTNPPALSFAYFGLSRAFSRSNVPQGIAYNVKVIECTPKNNSLHLRAALENALVYSQSSQIEKANTILTEIEATLKDPNNKELERFWSSFYMTKMNAALYSNRFDESVIYGQKAISENEKHDFLAQGTLGIVYQSIGKAYTALKDFDKAIVAINKGVEYFSDNENDATLGLFYQSLTELYLYKGDFKKAIAAGENAVTAYQKDSTNFSIHIMVMYFYLSESHMNIAADTTIRVVNLDKAEAYIRAALVPNNPYLHFNYKTLSKILISKKKYKDALEAAQKGLVLISKDFKDTDITKNPTAYAIYRQPTEAYYFLAQKGNAWQRWAKETKDISKFDLAFESYNLALNNIETFLPKTKAFDKTTFANYINYIALIDAITETYFDLYQLAPTTEILDHILHLTEKKKAIQLVETISPSPLPISIVQQEQSINQKMQHYRQQLDLATSLQQPDSIHLYQEALFEANQAMNQHLEKVKKDYPKESENFYHNQISTIKAVQNLLSDNTLFLSYSHINYVQIREKGLILALSKSSNKVVDFDISNLSANIKKLNELIQDPFSFQTGIKNEFIDLSHELYKTLIEPIESELEGKTKLMIVLEGQLFHLPFELLLKSNEKKPYHELDFLIKNYEVNYHYSATAFLRLQEKETIKDKSLLAFAPIFSKGDKLNEASRSLDFLVDSIYRSIENFEFIALPNTKKEVKTISKIINLNNGKTNVLLSENATKTNLSEQLEKQSYQFVHIATHGLVNFKNPKLSALACYSKNKKMDNLIYANEIQFKNINADLVVLSSCESGIGQLVAGEGLIALNRSFIYSGAKNVMFSLWKVSDKYSSELMIDFYKNYFETLSYTTALRQAKLKMLSNPTNAQPKYWSAFVLMGE